MIVIDTGVLSAAYRRRRRGAVEEQIVSELSRLLGGSVPLGVPGIVVQEVLSGVRLQEQFERVEGELRNLRPLLATREDHVAAARIYNDCARGGLTAGDEDCLIAAITIARRGSLYTIDPDFAAMAPHCGLALHRPA